MKQTMRHLLLLISLSMCAITAASEQQFTNGPEQAVLIELYTSEGCNSCPPAEEYLNSFKKRQDLWKTYIPLAFHVDYWDYLGWRDPYAHPAHGKRQSRYARQRNLSTVYTPAFVVNGRSWHKGWFSHEPPIGKKQVGTLRLNLVNRQLSAVFKPLYKLGGKLTLNIAVLGMNLQTHIKAGENSGRSAQHEFVVVGFKTVTSPNGHWKTTLPKLHYSGAEKYALAAWVNQPGDPKPLQATGGKILERLSIGPE